MGDNLEFHKMTRTLVQIRYYGDEISVRSGYFHVINTVFILQSTKIALEICCGTSESRRNRTGETLSSEV